VSGVPFTIQPAFAVQAQMPFEVPAGYEALNLITADYSHSFTLSNVYVLDSAGRALSFEIASESGADYRSSPTTPTSVPEPSPVLMLVGAMLLIAVMDLRHRAVAGTPKSKRASRI
jgi:hypothetical protein